MTDLDAKDILFSDFIYIFVVSCGMTSLVMFATPMQGEGFGYDKVLDNVCGLGKNMQERECKGVVNY